MYKLYFPKMLILIIKNKIMKISELRKLIREEITFTLKENNNLNHLKKFNGKIRVFDTKKMKSYEDVLPNEVEKVGGEIEVKDSFGEIYLVNRVKLKNGKGGYIWSKKEQEINNIKEIWKRPNENHIQKFLREEYEKLIIELEEIKNDPTLSPYEKKINISMLEDEISHLTKSWADSI
jgi:hypothetical protein